MIKLDEEKISERMHELVEGRDKARGKIYEAWLVLEKAKRTTEKAEGSAKISLKTIDPKITVDMMNCKVYSENKEYDKAKADEIQAEANYMIARGALEKMIDEFEALKSDSFMIGKLN